MAQLLRASITPENPALIAATTRPIVRGVPLPSLARRVLRIDDMNTGFIPVSSLDGKRPLERLRQSRSRGRGVSLAFEHNVRVNRCRVELDVQWGSEGLGYDVERAVLLVVGGACKGDPCIDGTIKGTCQVYEFE